MIRQVEEEHFVAEWDAYPSQGYTELNLCTYDSDSPGLFSRIAGVLASRGMNILAARIFTSRDGVVIDTVQVESPAGGPVPGKAFWQEVADAMRSVVEKTSRVEEMLVVRKTPSYLRKRKGRKIPPQILFDNAVSDSFTVIDVHAQDRIGLLYHITSCLAGQGVQIHSSKVTTEADLAIDAFYTTDIFGDKITRDGKLQEIRQALFQVLGEESSDS
jgi:[protein-PII] uridylyltransferase